MDIFKQTVFNHMLAQRCTQSVNQ